MRIPKLYLRHLARACTAFIFLVLLILVMALASCGAEPALAERPSLEVEVNFAYEPPPYDPCHDPLLKYEIGLEGRERQAKCDALNLANKERP